MDILSSIRSDNQRSLVIYIVPGGLAFWPFFLIAINRLSISYSVVQNNILFVGSIFLLLSLATGFVIEDLASRYELTVFDSSFKKQNAPGTHNFQSVWKTYLTIVIDKDAEPILIRYYRSILLRFKFELHTAISLVIMLLGQLILALNESKVDLVFSYFYTLGIMFLILYLHFEAKKGAELLHNKRIEIIRHYDLINEADSTLE